jgi:hypothetical protein
MSANAVTAISFFISPPCYLQSKRCFAATFRMMF